MSAAQPLLETPLLPALRTRKKYFREVAPVKVNAMWCKGCDLCSALCPSNVLKHGNDGKPDVAEPDECTQCGMCWMHCPDVAITSNYR